MAGYFDPRKSMLPIDPNSIEGQSVVQGVDPVRAVGQPAQKMGLGGKFLANANFDFPDQPASLPYRPNVLNALNAGAQGFLEGLSRGREAKDAREERADRKEDRAAGRKLQEEELALRRQQAEADREEAKARAEDRKFNRNLNTLKLSTELGVPYSMAGAMVDGSLAGGDEKINSYIDIATQEGRLDPRTKQLYGAMTAQISAKPGSAEHLEARLEALAEAGKMGMKIAQGEMDSIEINRKLAKLQLKGAERVESLGGFSPQQIESMAADAERNGLEMQNSIASRRVQLAGLLARTGAPDFASVLMGQDEGGMVDVLQMAKMQKNPEIKKLSEDILKDLATVQQLFDRARMQRQKIGSDVPALQTPDLSEPAPPPPEDTGLAPLLPDQSGSFGGKGVVGLAGQGVRAGIKLATGVDPKKAMTGLVEGKNEIIGAFSGTSRAQIAGDVQRTYDKAFSEKGDDAALLRLASNLKLRDPATGQTDEGATPQARAKAIKTLYARYKAAGREDEFNEYIQRLALGDEGYAGLSELLGVVGDEKEKPLDVIRKRARANSGTP